MDSFFALNTFDNAELVTDVISVIKQTIISFEDWPSKLDKAIKDQDLGDTFSILMDIMIEHGPVTTTNVFSRLLKRNNVTLLDLDDDDKNILHEIVDKSDCIVLAENMVEMVAKVAGDDVQELVLATNCTNLSLLHIVVCNTENVYMNYDMAQMYINQFVKLAGDRADELLNIKEDDGITALHIAEACKDEDMVALLQSKMK